MGTAQEAARTSSAAKQEHRLSNHLTATPSSLKPAGQHSSSASTALAFQLLAASFLVTVISVAQASEDKQRKTSWEEGPLSGLTLQHQGDTQKNFSQATHFIPLCMHTTEKMRRPKKLMTPKYTMSSKYTTNLARRAHLRMPVDLSLRRQVPSSSRQGRDHWKILSQKESIQ